MLGACRNRSPAIPGLDGFMHHPASPPSTLPGSLLRSRPYANSPLRVAEAVLLTLYLQVSYKARENGKVGLVGGLLSLLPDRLGYFDLFRESQT